MGKVIAFVFCFGLGALFGTHRLWLPAMIAWLAPQLQASTNAVIQVDPDALRHALEVGKSVDAAAQRTAVEGALRQVEEMNRSIRPPLPPMPPSFPSMTQH
jgi:hypothetical protein